MNKSNIINIDKLIIHYILFHNKSIINNNCNTPNICYMIVIIDIRCLILILKYDSTF